MGNQTYVEAGIFMVRFLNFLTQVANDPSVVLKDSPEYRSLLAGFGLLKNSSEFKAASKTAPTETKPLDLKDFLEVLAPQIEKLQTNALVRLTVAGTMQDLSVAESELQTLDRIFQIMNKIVEQKQAAARATLESRM